MWLRQLLRPVSNEVMDLVRKYWFPAAALVLSLVLVANLSGGFDRLDLVIKGFKDKSLVTDKEKWQRWLDGTPRLFESLVEGAKIGIARDHEDGYGIIWTMMGDGFRVERTNQLRKAGPGIILVFDDQVASELQSKSDQREVIRFLRNHSQTGKVQAYYLLNNDARLKEEGYWSFLQEIGLRPFESPM